MKTFMNYILLCLLVMSMSGCAVVGGIFKAGMVWGILLVVGIIGLIIYLIAGRKK
jgi:hypothetical protein